MQVRDLSVEELKLIIQKTVADALQSEELKSHQESNIRVRYNLKGRGTPLPYSLDENQPPEESDLSDSQEYLCGQPSSSLTKSVSYNYKGRGTPLPYPLDEE